MKCPSRHTLAAAAAVAATALAAAVGSAAPAASAAAGAAMAGVPHRGGVYAPYFETWTKDSISAEIIDLRTLWPMDIETIVRSVEKTGRCVVVEEGWAQSGVGAEIAARLMERAFDYLDAPVARVSGKDVPMPYAANLEKLALPSVVEVVEAAKAVCYR